MKKSPETSDSPKPEPPEPSQPPARFVGLVLPEPFTREGRRAWVDPAIVFGVALVLRLTFYFLNLKNNPSFNFPIMDSLYHHQWANEIISGSFWGAEVFFRGPMYPYLLALIYKISGSSIAAGVFFQHVLGSFTSVLVYLLSREYFSRRVSLVAGLVAALYWVFVFFEGELLIVTVTLFLNTLFLFLLARAVNSRNVALLVAAGLVLGLSAIARPTILVFVPAIPFVLRMAGRQSEARAGWIGRSAVVVAACFVVILPVLVRNYVVGKAFVPIASSGGVNFYIGNNPIADGCTAIVPGTNAPWQGGNAEAIAIAEMATGKKLNPAEVSEYYFQRGFDFVLSRPDDAAGLLLKKLHFFWTSPELSNDKFIHFFWGLAGLGRVPLPGFWIVAPLAILGGILQWRRRRELAALYLFVALYTAVVIAFFVIARFRLPVVPVLIIFAAFAVLHLIELFRVNKGRLLAYCAVLALLVAAVNHNAYAFHKRKPVQDTISRYTLGSAYLQKGDKEKAIAEYELARESYRRHRDSGYELISLDVNAKLAALYYEQGNCEKTAEVMDGVRGVDERTVSAMHLQAECLQKLQRPTAAIYVYQDILKIVPGHPNALVGLAGVYESTGQYQNAESTLLRLVRRPDNVHFPALLALARVHLRQGKIAEAIEEYSNIARYKGYEGWAHVVMADIFLKTGKPDKAREALDRAAPHLPADDPTFIRVKKQLQTFQK